MVDYEPRNWFDHLCDIRGSMVREISVRVLYFVAWATAVTVVHQMHWLDLSVPDRGHFLVGVALGLLLVFRTNASYDRYWDGRRQWGVIINEARNLGRVVSTHLTAAPDLGRRAIGWTMAFPHATLHLLRHPAGIPSAPSLGPAAAWLPDDEVQAALAAEHVPLAVARQIGVTLANARGRGAISEGAQFSMDQSVRLLLDALGACERIHRTPLPFAYVVHLRRALILYCLTLPFVLVEPFGWLTIVVTLLLSYTLLGIEEIGVEIENPFGADDNDLPLERFCATTDRNLAALAGLLPPGPDSSKSPTSADLCAKDVHAIAAPRAMAPHVAATVETRQPVEQVLSTEHEMPS